MGIDRYLNGTRGSIRNADQVQRCAAAFIQDELLGFGTQLDIHFLTSSHRIPIHSMPV